jgi:hypothetical protein
MLTPLSIETSPYVDTTLAISDSEQFARIASIDNDEDLGFYYWLDIYEQ